MAVTEPTETLDRVMVRVREWSGARPARVEYEPKVGWEALVHEQLGCDWPCPAQKEFDALWSEIEDQFRTTGHDLGRMTYGGCDDADRGLARALWCLVAHLRPERIVETGVAHGVSSRVLLERLERNGEGHLWSIDLPDVNPTLHDQIAIVVPDALRDRWTYVSGTSRKRLGPLLAELGEIDLFVHDSSPTERNVRFELSSAWDALQSGAIVADDLQRSYAWKAFSEARPEATSYVVRADDGGALFGIALKGLRGAAISTNG
jgi:hypothetical protein